MIVFGGPGAVTDGTWAMASVEAAALSAAGRDGSITCPSRGMERCLNRNLRSRPSWSLG